MSHHDGTKTLQVPPSSATIRPMEIYLGSPIEHASERMLLEEIERLASSAQDDVIVLVNVNFSGRQIDAILCIEDRTIVLEAKGYSRPIRGGLNGQWQLKLSEDNWKNVGNPYLQTLSAKNALRDTMRAFDEPTEPAYPSAAVVITPDLPSGSAVEPGDLKVGIIGLPSLERTIQAAPKNSWPLARWRAFAQYHRLTHIATIAAAFDKCVRTDEHLLKTYASEFALAYGRVVREQVAFDCKIDNERTVTSEEVARTIGAGASLLICGLSGCGKSMLSVSGAVAALDEGVVSIVLAAKHYETSIKAVLNREVGLLGARSAVELLAAAQRSSRAILLVVDGYNECTPDRRSALTRALVALRRRYACSLVITSRGALARPDLLSLRPVEVLPPSLQVKRSIASDAIGGHPLSPHVNWLLEMVTSGLEARLVGEVGQTLASQPSRHALFDAFARRRLGNAASAGIRVLASIAQWLSDHLTFSVSARTIERMVSTEDIQAGVPTKLADLGLLNLLGERLSFSHEMFFHAFAAEAIVRSAGGNVEMIVEALRDPRHRDRVDLIVGAIDDVGMLKQVLEQTSDATLVGACFWGACGRFPREWVEAQYPRVLTRLGEEIASVSCAFNPESSWKVSVSAELPVSQMAPDGALLKHLPELVLRGRYLEEIWDLLALFDKRLRVERTRLQDEARQIGVGLKSSMFAAAYVMAGPGAPAITCVCLGLRNGFRRVADAVSPRLEQLAAAGEITPGQLYVWANLCKHVEDRGAVATLAPFVTELIQRYGATSPYHVQLNLVDAASHCLQSPPPRNQHLIEALKSLLDDRNIGLNSSIIEALERHGEIELDDPSLEPGILQTISDLVSEPDDSERWPEAYGIFGSQYDGPYSDTYYRVVQGLPSEQRKVFFEMAVKGADYADLFLSIPLLDLAAFNDPQTAPAFQRWTVPPARDAFMPQQAIEVFVLAHIALARLRLAYQPRDNNNAMETAVLACGQILYWGNRIDVPEEVKAHALRQACLTLRSPDAHPYSLNVIAGCSNLMIGSTAKFPGGKAKLSIAELCPHETAAICRTGLESPERLAGYFQHYGDYDRKQDQSFALQVLSRYGSSIDLPLLRRFAQSADLSRIALDGIRYLEERLNDPRSSDGEERERLE